MYIIKPEKFLKKIKQKNLMGPKDLYIPLPQKIYTYINNVFLLLIIYHL